MKELNSKKALATVLSRLKTFKAPKVSLEQYQTDSEIAADILWFSGMMGEIDGKVIVDLGAGNGILGLGALLLGAKKAIFVEKDEEVIEKAEENYKNLKSEFNIGEAEFVNKPIAEFCQNADIIFENPPFGTKNKHADKEFLEKAFTIAPIIHTLHKAETKNFVEQISKDKEFKITHYKEFKFPLKATLSFHKNKIKHILVGYWRLENFINKMPKTTNNG